MKGAGVMSVSTILCPSQDPPVSVSLMGIQAPGVQIPGVYVASPPRPQSLGVQSGRNRGSRDAGRP